MKGWLNHNARTCPPAAADRDAQDEVPPPLIALVDVLDHAADALQPALLQLGDVALVAEVLVIAGKEEQHVADRVQPQPFEQFGPGRPHALEKLHRREQLLRRRQVGGSHPRIVTRRRAKGDGGKAEG